MKRLLILCMVALSMVPAMAQGEGGTPSGYVKIIGTDGLTPVSVSNPLPVDATVTVGAVTANNTVNGVNGTTPATYANPFPISIGIGGAVVSATNGTYANILQGNAVISSGNPLFFSLAGTNTLTTLTTITNPVGVKGTSGSAIASPTNPLDARLSADGTNPVDSGHPLQVAGPVTVSSGAVTATISGTPAVTITSGTVTTVTTVTNPVGVKGYDGSGIATNLNPVPTSPDGVATANITNTNQAISSSATTVTLTAASRHLKMWTSAGASDINVTFNGDTPDTTKPYLYGGAGLDIDFGVPVTTFKYKGTGSVGTLNYVAQ